MLGFQGDVGSGLVVENGGRVEVLGVSPEAFDCTSPSYPYDHADVWGKEEVIYPKLLMDGSIIFPHLGAKQWIIDQIGSDCGGAE